MTTSSTPSPGFPAPRPPLLIGDADRARAQDRLSRAVGCGELTLDEFDDRLQAALHARTYADLELLLADLPSAVTGSGGVPIAWTPPAAAVVSPSLQVAGRPVGRGATPARVVTRMPLTAATEVWVRWAGLAALLIVIWVAVGIPTGAWYPWPVWPILGTAVGAVRHSVEQSRVGRAGLGA